MFPGRNRWARTRGWIIAGTVAYLAGGAGIALFKWTVDLHWLVLYSRVPGALFLFGLAVTGFWLSYQVSREFAAGEPLLAGWRLIALSGAFDMLGAIEVQMLSVDSVLNPLRVGAWWSPGLGSDIHEWGLFLGGPCRLLVLGAGLLFVLEVYRRSEFLARLTVRDWVIVSAMAIYVLVEMWAVVESFRHGKRPGLGEMLHYPTDPLLLLLLCEALVLYRSVARMGASLVGWCWLAFSNGIILTAIGDLLILAEDYGHIQWPWSAINWFVWFPAAAYFAVAPTYQLEAIASARARRTNR